MYTALLIFCLFWYKATETTFTILSSARLFVYPKTDVVIIHSNQKVNTTPHRTHTHCRQTSPFLLLQLQIVLTSLIVTRTSRSFLFCCYRFAQFTLRTLPRSHAYTVTCKTMYRQWKQSAYIFSPMLRETIIYLLFARFVKSNFLAK